MKHMNTHALALRRPASAVAALAAAAGLVLAGCSAGGSGSAGTSGSSGSSGSTGSTSAGTTSGGSGGSGGSTSVVSSSSVPFPIEAGNTWKYTDTTNGVSGSKSVDRIAAVKPVSAGQQVTMDSTITTLGTTSHSTGYFIFHSDGSISYPFSQFNTGSSQAKVTLLSGNILWPPAAQIDSGQVSHDTLKIEFDLNGVKKDLTAHITVKGDGTQSITVPAGSYTATVVDMTESEKIEGIAVSSEIKTWLANGVGPVKSEVILHEDGHNSVAAENVLTSFTKG
jgi:hypothetical protein